MLGTTDKILVLVFLLTSMMSIGMQTRLSDLRAIVESRDILVRVLLANFLIVPILGMIIVRIFPLPPHVASAILLLAFAPGGLGALQFTSHVKGSAPLAGALTFLLSIPALFITPLILPLVLPENVAIIIPYDRVLLFLLVYLLFPILVGMLLYSKVPRIATKFSKPVGLVGVAAFIAFAVVTSSFRKEAVSEIGMPGIVAMLLFIFVSMVVGWFMGGPTRDLRQILATTTSMRNALLCLAIVQSSAPDHAVLVPLIAFSLLMVPPNMVFTVYSAVHSKRRARQEV